MTNSEARKRKMGEPPSEHSVAAQEIATEIDQWFLDNQTFLSTMPVKEAVALIAWNMGIIVGGHATR